MFFVLLLLPVRWSSQAAPQEVAAVMNKNSSIVDLLEQIHVLCQIDSTEMKLYCTCTQSVGGRLLFHRLFSQWSGY